MTADTVGGVWTYALELVQALQPYGIQVHLATMGRLPSPAQQAQAAGIENLWLHASNYQLEWMDDPWQEVDAAGVWLQTLEEELRPDLIHLNNYCHGKLPWQAPVLMVGHSCVLSWWEAVKGEWAPSSYETYFRRVRNGIQAADRVVAPTYAFLQCLEKFYGSISCQAVIPNGRDGSYFRPAPKEDFILSMGRLWDEAKNIGACEPAARQLPWPIKVAGDPGHPVNGKSTVYSGLEWLGQLDQQEIASQLGKASIYLMPAKYEPFGLSILEAAFSGCALLLGDIPSLRENWEGAALFCDPEDPQELSDKLSYLIKNPSLREKMGKKARERANVFSTEKKAASYAALYGQLLEKAASEEKKVLAKQHLKP